LLQGILEYSQALSRTVCCYSKYGIAQALFF